jgi:uncharacterized circularly permuted ATP-grasp superfamily protein
MEPVFSNERLKDLASSLLLALSIEDVTFACDGPNGLHERVFPFDPIPRLIPQNEFDRLEEGIKQRVVAMNMFLQDIYHEGKIFKDKVFSESFFLSSSGYMVEAMGITPPKGVFLHLSGIDLVRTADAWFVLEDNLRIPSGVSYALKARELYETCIPDVLAERGTKETLTFLQNLGKAFSSVNAGGEGVILSPGRHNAAFFEHAYLAESLGMTLAFGEDLLVYGEDLFLRGCFGKRHKVGFVYKRLNDEYLDPVMFNPASVIGVPNIYPIYKKGKVGIGNALGTGVADDKGVFYYTPQIIRYYLGQDPILPLPPTYLPEDPKDAAFVFENMGRLVIKEVNSAGGFGVRFGPRLTKAELAELKVRIVASPRGFIAQELLDFEELDVRLQDGTYAKRRADLRMYAVMGEDVSVLQGGLSRFSGHRGSYLVNSCQGGGYKDTWVYQPAQTA